MRRFYGERKDEYFFISDDENNHLRNVLRLNVGDKIICFNGDGKEYVCEIVSCLKKSTQAVIIESGICKTTPLNHITLYIASCKREKLELIIQKAVELGIYEVVIFPSAYSVAKFDLHNRARFETIVINALKQCERCDSVSVRILPSFDSMLDELSNFEKVFFAYEREENQQKYDFNYKNFAIIVGCEGGFEKGEVEKLKEIKNVTAISLGKRILRCETAGIVMMGIASYLSGN